MAYIQVTFRVISAEQSEILVASMSDHLYEGFEEENGSLKAYIGEEDFDEEPVRDLALKLGVEYCVEQLADTNWNEVWESNFQPVVVDNFCAIRADFHKPLKNVMHEIVITPKMSFGTGHHPTTYMMIKQMETIDFSGKEVLDFGTGTGVLAILAQKLGASKTTAIDNDEWSITNAEENLKRNGCRSIHLYKDDNLSAAGNFNIILANITRNVILAHLSAFRQHLSEDGILLLSGLLSEDRENILSAAKQYQLVPAVVLTEKNWISIRLIPG